MISTIPLRNLIKSFECNKNTNVVDAANSLKHRDFIIVALVLDQKDLFPDHWIYIHDPDSKVARIQNFKNWSSSMVADQKTSCIGMEYFISRDNQIWNKEDNYFTKLALKELRKLGLAPEKTKILNSKVEKVYNAYPVYDLEYKSNLNTIKNFLENNFSSLFLAGRNGLHRYNNQDHSIMTGFIAARNIINGNKNLSPWKINQDAIYLEEVRNVSAG